jgi:hypothetical protein
MEITKSPEPDYLAGCRAHRRSRRPASWGQAESVCREQSIPILAATTGEHASGTVVYVVVAFEERPDWSGLQMTFHSAPGRLSRLAQTAVQEALLHTPGHSACRRIPGLWH